MVRKYCTLYFAILVLFVVVIAAPAVASKFIKKNLGSKMTGTFQGIFQPRGTHNNDTGKVSTWWETSGIKLTFWSFTPSSRHHYTSKDF